MLNLPRVSNVCVVSENGASQSAKEANEKYRNKVLEEYYKLISEDYTEDHLYDLLKCPITGNIFLNPVTTPDGHTYEQKAIEQWINDKSEDPLSASSLSLDNLRPNNEIKNIIDSLFALDENLSSKLQRGVGKRDLRDVCSSFKEKLNTSLNISSELALLPFHLLSEGAKAFKEGQYAKGSCKSALGLSAVPIAPAGSVTAYESSVSHTLEASADALLTSAGLREKHYKEIAEQRQKDKAGKQASEQSSSFCKS